MARESIDRTAALFARVLGARQLVEGLLLARHGEHPWPAVGAAVDAVHALTMVGVAALGGSHRRLALVNAAMATGFAAEGFRESRRTAAAG